MPSFTVRIELHDASLQDFENLYSAMIDEGFTDIIKSDTGKQYRMLPAEYDFDGHLTLEQVLYTAKQAAAKTGKKYAVFVAESKRRTWAYLEEVK
ncbi:hypothetical protein [Larkinella rosea]|uniref:DUF2622 domain-containing protein n=1 Tax=Larkinella rosea TaxID=2025312 RepID=A0A3P1BVI9_9BACT|nr:hypothetical protein [Larkinella rosea]RRB04929.1 hypothetical protein EHT25_15845 [Larkinella rosea]